MFTMVLPLYLTRKDLKQSLGGLTVRRTLHVCRTRGGMQTRFHPP